MHAVGVAIGAILLAFVALSIPASFLAGYLIVERHIARLWQRVIAGAILAALLLPFAFAAAYLAPNATIRDRVRCDLARNTTTEERDDEPQPY